VNINLDSIMKKKLPAKGGLQKVEGKSPDIPPSENSKIVFSPGEDGNISVDVPPSSGNINIYVQIGDRNIHNNPVLSPKEESKPSIKKRSSFSNFVRIFLEHEIVVAVLALFGYSKNVH